MSSSIVVLTYHRVAADEEHAAAMPGLVSSTAAVFERQMEHLAKRYVVLGPEEVLHAINTGRLPRRAAMVTFDDAYDDFASVAWPILRRLGLPATVFVPTAFAGTPGRPFWWDRLAWAIRGYGDDWLPHTPIGPLRLDRRDGGRKAIRRLKDALMRLPHDEAMDWVDRICRLAGDPPVQEATVLGWVELRALAAEGVTIGAHTRNHPLLTRIPYEEAADEIRGSCDDVERGIGVRPVCFCYPGGYVDDRVAALAREAGLRLAFTCNRGSNPFPFRDPLRLRRLDVTRRTTVETFRLRLLRAVQIADRLQNRVRTRVRAVAAERRLRAAGTRRYEKSVLSERVV